MKTRRVLRYWCDFCKRPMSRRDAMERHERRCVKNPARECKHCELDGSIAQQPLPDLFAALDAGGIAALEAAAAGCPTCMLAAVVQRKQRLIAEGESEAAHAIELYDYEAQAAKFWTRIESQREEAMSFQYVGD